MKNHNQDDCDLKVVTKCFFGIIIINGGLLT